MKEKIMGILLVFALIGAFRINSPFKGEPVSAYTSISNLDNRDIDDVRLDYIVYDVNGDALDSFTSRDFDVDSGAETGIRTSYSGNLRQGEYSLKVTARSETRNSFRQAKYLPFFIEG